jgi:hypothetical protein
MKKKTISHGGHFNDERSFITYFSKKAAYSVFLEKNVQ